jgi:two-component system sensor histidine kinase QseC
VKAHSSHASYSSYSLRLRILLGVLAAVTIAWMAVSVAAYRAARHEAEELLDAHLAQSATLLLSFLGDEAHELEEGHLPRHRYDKKVAFQIWEGGEQLLSHSDGAPDTRLSPSTEGFSDVSVAGKDWRVFSTWDSERDYLVQVADASSSRDDISQQIAWHLLLPLVFGLPVLGLVLGSFILGAFRPLTRLADSIAAQAPGRLQAIALPGAPSEILPILERLNQLFERVSHTQDDERRFTADAAHELRTPLAVLQTYAEVASAASDDATRRHALDNLLSGSRRATRLLEQLLMLARLDAQSALPGIALCDLRSIVIDTVATLIPAALNKSIEVEVDEGPPAIVKGAAMLLQVLVRNLVDNAIRYTPAGGHVKICVKILQPPQGNGVCLQVTDSGPGIPEALRPEALGRFRRLDESGEEGHGLGLSIVARIAELHGSSVVLGTKESASGLVVSVSFATNLAPDRQERATDPISA